MADLLCTIDQVKARLGITDTTDDTVLTELVTEVSAWVESYTGRKLAPDNAATYRFDTVAGYALKVPYGVRTVTTLKVATSHQPDSGGTYTTVSSADYILRPKPQDAPIGWPYTEIRISRAATGSVAWFADAENGAEVTGNFGFSATPPEVEAVVVDAVVVAYASRGNGASGVVGADGFSGPPWSQYFGKGSPQRATLDRYAVAGF